MGNYRAPLKDKLVKIYSIDRVSKDGKSIIYKTYPYGRKMASGIHANVMFAKPKDKTILVQMGVQTDVAVLTIYINWRKNITVGQYVEYNGDSYIIALPPDPYMFHQRELKITAVYTPPARFTDERYME